MLVEDTAGYKKMLRMNCATFEKILTAILNESDDFRGRELTRKLAWSNRKNYHHLSCLKKLKVNGN